MSTEDCSRNASECQHLDCFAVRLIYKYISGHISNVHFFSFFNFNATLLTIKSQTRPGVSKVRPTVWFLSLPFRLTKRTVLDCSTMFCMHHAFGHSCTEFVYPGCWHNDNGATNKINDVLTEHVGLLHVLPIAVHLTDK